MDQLYKSIFEVEKKRQTEIEKHNAKVEEKKRLKKLAKAKRKSKGYYLKAKDIKLNNKGA